MKLSLTNIGKVKKADIEINGITVIAGENNTGKSTVGKVLFCIFNAFFNVEQQVREEQIQAVKHIIERNLDEVETFFSTQIISEQIGEYIADKTEATGSFESEEVLSLIPDAIKRFNEQHKNILEPNPFSEDLTRQLSDRLRIPSDMIVQRLLNARMYSMFNGQINDIYSDEPGGISLTIKSNPLSIIVIDNEIEQMDGSFNLKTEAIYIDNPFIIDERRHSVPKYRRVGLRRNYDYRTHLINLLSKDNKNSNVIDEILIAEKFDAIFNEIGLESELNMYSNKRSRSIGTNPTSEKKKLDTKNLSTGLKTFLIIKTLLDNGTIQQNGTIILDEPEIHLHPEWQILFAKLIVLIQKEFGMHILLNTHSPYFLRAIQVYSAEYGIADMCKYYMSELVEGVAYINDVSDDIEQIYKKLAMPFQKLEDDRWNND